MWMQLRHRKAFDRLFLPSYGMQLQEEEEGLKIAPLYSWDVCAFQLNHLTRTSSSPLFAKESNTVLLSSLGFYGGPAKPDWVLFACWLALNTVKYSSGPSNYHPPAEDDARTICDNIKQQEWWSTRRRGTLTRMYFWGGVELGSIRADDEDRQQNHSTDHHILGTAHFVLNCLCGWILL